jgi:hypothetical protein
MSDGDKKPRLHIHLGGLIILVIIFLLLFKVDLRSKIESPQFQKNYTYISVQVSNFWQKYILYPIKSKLGNFIFKQINTKIEDFQGNFQENLLKNKNIENGI